MNQHAMKVLAAAVGLACAGAVQAQQTLTFSNTDTDPGPATTPLSVTLLAGSSVSIAPNGNVTAQCALTGSLCTGLGVGGGAAPAVSLAASGFSASPTDGRYPVGTSFLITPTVTSAEICVRTVEAGTPGNTNWPATVSPPFAAQTVQMLTGDATYSFSMRCYGAGGATTFTLPPVQTAPGSAGACAGFTPPLPAGWSRSSIVRTNQVLRIDAGLSPWEPFPVSGGSGILVTGDTQYHAIEFATPAGPTWEAYRQFFWEPVQGLNAPVDTNNVYVSISSCPGDFRIPQTDSTAPADDPTFASGCRNFRKLQGFPNPSVRTTIVYQIGTEPADEFSCRLAPGRTYYINFIRARVQDGAIGTPSQEATCQEPSQPPCGIQMRYF
jgi:hypothetical protein